MGMKPIESDPYHSKSHYQPNASSGSKHALSGNHQMFGNIKYNLSHLAFSSDADKKCMYIGCLEKKYYKNLRKKHKMNRKKGINMVYKKNLKKMETNLQSKKNTKK